MIKLGEVHTKMIRQARSWRKGDQSKWMKLTLGGEDEEVEIRPRANVYVRGFVFANRDGIECVVGLRDR